MSTQIIVPTLGESISEATVLKWLKQVGEAVAPDEPLVELETDKVTVEVPAPAGGTLESIAADEGSDVAVGAVLGAIGDGATVAASPSVPAPAKGNGTSNGAGNGKSNGAAAGTVAVTVPELGESITEGTVGKWLKSVGDTVKVDDALVEIETDKVTAELPAPVAGVLAEILAAEGTDVGVGAVIAHITSGAAPTAAAAPVAAPTQTPAAAPPVQAPVQAAASSAPLSPAVRKLVDEHGVDPSKISPSGKDGRLTKGDVLAHLGNGAAPAAAAAPTPAPAPASTVKSAPAADLPPRQPDPRGEEAVRMTKLRRTIARRLKQAQETAAMLTTFN